MDSREARSKAKNKLHFWTFILFSIIVIGAGFEYFSLTQPLNEITVVYVPQKGEPASVQNKIAKAISEPKAIEQKPSVIDTHPHAAQELLNYMNEMKQKVEDVTFTETALDKIKQNPKEPEQPTLNQPQFEENKIEIYDEHKGVVEVIETPTATISPNAPENDLPEIKPVTPDEVVTEIEAELSPKEQEIADQASQAVQELINAVSTTDDEEKPIVLIPALQQNQE